MIILGAVEGLQRDDLRRDRLREAPARGQGFLRGLRQLALRLVAHEDGGSILPPPVGELPTRIGGIDLAPEDVEQGLVAHASGVVAHLDRLGVPRRCRTRPLRRSGSARSPRRSRRSRRSRRPASRTAAPCTRSSRRRRWRRPRRRVSPRVPATSSRRSPIPARASAAMARPVTVCVDFIVASTRFYGRRAMPVTARLLWGDRTGDLTPAGPGS